MASAGESHSLARFRPLVLTVCGAAAAFSIYQVYKAYQPPPGPGLRRQASIHRRRRRRESRSASPSPAVAEPRVPPPELVLEDVETVAETHISASGPTVGDVPGGGHSELTELLYRIGENRAREAGYVHRGVTCDSCGTVPITGIRWHCMQCEDFDLCSDCEAQGLHNRTHVFGKIKIPAPALVGSVKLIQPVIYTGFPGSLPPSLPTEIRRQLHQDTTLEIEVLDALYDQFSCLTTLHGWQHDPTDIGSGIDRAGFDKGFFASYLTTPKHNLIYDRYFHFFDMKKDGVIDFVEYATAIAIHTNLKGRNAKLKAVFDGYDIDEDGFVSRRDFLRMLRSYFTLQRIIVQDALEHEEGLGLKMLEGHLASAQPLGAVFKTSYNHRGDPNRIPNAKVDGEDSDFATDRPIISADSRDDGSRWGAINGQTRMSTGSMQKRWQQRRFYSDEEEGAGPPTGWVPSDPSGNPRETSAQGLPNGESTTTPSKRGVRSRSASSSSCSSESSARPRMDGDLRGYEVPPEEEDVPTDVLFQITQQGLNELLDPLFVPKETQADQVRQTRAERAKWSAQIDSYRKRVHEMITENSDPLLATATAIERHNTNQANSKADPLPTAPTPPLIHTVEPSDDTAPVAQTQDAVTEVTDSIRRLPTGRVADRIQAMERQVEDASLEQLLSDSGYSIGISRMSTFVESSEVAEMTGSGMLPHLRPSTPELERLESRARNALHRVASPQSPLFVLDDADIHPMLRKPFEERMQHEPDAARLQFYSYLDVCEKEINTRGGEGRISWEEFRAAVADEDGDGKFGFLEDWIRIGQI